MRTLLVSLNEHPLALLRAIAELRDVSLASNVRADVASQLAAALADPAATRAAVTGCSPEAQAAWHGLVSAGGRMKAAAFARLHGEIRPIGPGRLEREATWRDPANAAEELWYRGLIYRAFAEFGEGPLEYIYIPEDLPIPEDLAAAAPAPYGPALMPSAAPAQARHARNTLAVDACTVLAAFRATPAPLDRAGALAEGAARELRQQLLSDDPVRLDFLLALLTDCGWLAADRGRLVVNHQASSRWLRGTHWEQVTQLFAAWRDSTTWNDLRRVPALRPEGEWRNDPLLPRRGLLQTLARLDPSAWYRLTDLVAAFKTSDPDFLRPDGNYTGWYLKDAETGLYLNGFEAWEQVEGRLLAFLITGPLYWLGAVVCGTLDEAEPGAMVFRLTAWGEAWLAGGIPAELPRPVRLAVSEDFTVRAPLFCPLLDRFRLLRITEPLAVAGPEAAGAEARPALASVTHTRHRITRASLAAARASGIQAQAVLDFLKRAGGAPVPARVAAALGRYDQLGGALRVTRGAVLRVPDASMLGTLRADPAIAPLLGEIISAQAVIIPEANVSRVLALLQDSGYTVKLD